MVLAIPAVLTLQSAFAFTTSTASMAAAVQQQDGPSNVWVAVLHGDLGSFAAAWNVAEVAVLDFGVRLGVVYSSDYPNLRPGYWVVYTGPFPSEAAARTAADHARNIGYAGAYPRWLGERLPSGYLLPYPTSNFWAVILHGDLRNEGDAWARAQTISREYSYGDGAIDVLFSSDYSNLRPGYWVVYVRGIANEAEAQREAQRWRERGYAGAYPRWVGDRR
jgi:hypothetical protein